MIGVFPSLYPDELMYSVLARYAVRSGYLIYRAVAEDVLHNKTERPSIEFLNLMTDDVLARLSVSLPTLIHQNTMFDYYARFVPHEKRTKLFHALAGGDMKTFGNSISLRHDGKEHFLRYCPVCAQEDRQQYGETYWHRCHQLPEIPICPVHHVTLCESSVTTSSKGTPSYISAEEVVPTKQQTTMCTDDAIIRIAHYCRSVFESGYNESNTTPFSDFLNARMEYTEYRSPRGEVKKLAKLYADFRSYYSADVLNGFTEQWQITKLLTGDRHNFYEVCLLAYFLGISADELYEMALPKLSQKERFDMQVQEWHAQGIKSPEISRRLGGASVNVIKPVATGAYFHKQNSKPPSNRKPKSKAIDWEALDIDFLPRVQAAVFAMGAVVDGQRRPVKVSVAAVGREVGLAEQRLKFLPQCMAWIREHGESRDRFVARCLVWAYRQCLKDEKKMTRTRLLARVNIRVGEARGAIKELKRLAESREAEIIRDVLGDHFDGRG